MMWALGLLFLSAFGAATLLPLQSEVVLVGLLAQMQYPVWLLVAVASLGNILGSCVNWWLGLKVEQYKNKKWFPVSEQKMLQAQGIYQKYGFWSLLLSWVPVIGDPITLIAGLLKENFVRFVVMVSIAKIGRYLFVYWMFSQF
ncbi:MULTISPECIES: YqaA family protein [Acinetobacter]|jgi:membrane protein YqaA with SNARE-associated domain|uniref:DedA family protein n=1 Tax=Acinetobacter johnsonii TaxID=40214 RepID=A0AAJ6IB43_ACIJO|nr:MULTISPECIES: YqaA family protein [Acinetobacter]ALV73855.1 membrane protein [Acinetobacter johnsonii XBB1]MBL4861369.1 DedA family protein [Acinetobacter sp.]MBO7706838.1 DedA family protein [Acinetobacter sp.]MCV2449948.1 DedA family protein [Acinetobacter johnsonii]MDG9787537.1 DedA family protein [Acinetobacter johnsonii]